MTNHGDEALAQADVSSEGGFGYRRITDALIGDIKAGRWSVAGKLPTEAELVERFGASRNTIRESMRELELFGYIKRRRGTRSVLLSTDPSSSFVNSVQSIGELLQYSRRTVSRVIAVEIVVATADLAERLGVTPGSRWLRVEVLRMPTRGALPLGFSEIYVDERYADLADKMRAGGTVYRVLEEELGLTFSRVEQMIEAGAATAKTAQFLKVPMGSPLMVVRTEFVTSAGEIAEIGFGHFPAGRYRMEIILMRGPGGRADE